ncbi:hypothetical protein [Paenibacillus phoenicis]|uniref:hypothetical protein n=1 Tax=Paenibacillus phoenicis TaxID=554117 RepID=UPI003D2A6AE4
MRIEQAENAHGFDRRALRTDHSIKEIERARIRVKGMSYYLGEYDTIEEAAAAREAGQEKYHKPYLEELEDEIEKIPPTN